MQFWGTDFSQLTEAEMQPTLFGSCVLCHQHIPQQTQLLSCLWGLVCFLVT